VSNPGLISDPHGYRARIKKTSEAIDRLLAAGNNDKIGTRNSSSSSSSSKRRSSSSSSSTSLKWDLVARLQGGNMVSIYQTFSKHLNHTIVKGVGMIDCGAHPKDAFALLCAPRLRRIWDGHVEFSETVESISGNGGEESPFVDIVYTKYTSHGWGQPLETLLLTQACQHPLSYHAKIHLTETIHSKIPLSSQRSNLRWMRIEIIPAAIMRRNAKEGEEEKKRKKRQHLSRQKFQIEITMVTRGSEAAATELQRRCILTIDKLRRALVLIVSSFKNNSILTDNQHDDSENNVAAANAAHVKEKSVDDDEEEIKRPPEIALIQHARECLELRRRGEQDRRVGRPQFGITSALFPVSEMHPVARDFLKISPFARLRYIVPRLIKVVMGKSGKRLLRTSSSSTTTTTTTATTIMTDNDGDDDDDDVVAQ